MCDFASSDPERSVAVIPALEMRVRREESSSSRWEAGEVSEMPMRTLAMASVA